MPNVTFLPFGTAVAVADGETVFDAGRRAGVPIPTACVGKANCGLCRVKVVDGEAHLSALNADEKKHLGNTYFISKLRLSCQARVTGGDVTVVLPDAARQRLAPK
jgi:2Fe-2S ferredoxin